MFGKRVPRVLVRIIWGVWTFWILAISAAGAWFCVTHLGGWGIVACPIILLLMVATFWAAAAEAVDAGETHGA